MDWVSGVDDPILGLENDKGDAADTIRHSRCRWLYHCRSSVAFGAIGLAGGNWHGCCGLEVGAGLGAEVGVAMTSGDAEVDVACIAYGEAESEADVGVGAVIWVESEQNPVL